jgi:two-component sensor histidine kinase
MKQPHASIALNIEANNISLNINTSIPLGLLINEIVTNSMKHGFSERNSGEIYIRITRENDHYFLLQIGDSGIGYTQDLSIEKAESLGLQLITSLAEQLMGNVECCCDKPGTHYCIRFQELRQSGPLQEDVTTSSHIS